MPSVACTTLATFLPVILPISIAPPALALHHMKRFPFEHHIHHHARHPQAHIFSPEHNQGFSPAGTYNRPLPPFASTSHGSSGSGSSVPLVVTNQCRETIYPGILTQSGTGPGSTGFKLDPNSQKRQSVSHDWQGRVWGRTNCSFNSQGTAAYDGSGVACGTGDCGGSVSCMGAGVIPVTLAEFTLNANGQTFYDISLVDGYNIPLGIVSLYPQSGNSSLEAIPPNLTNPICIGTASELGPPGSTDDSTLGSNGSYPLPLEQSLTAGEVAQWCPWSLQLHVPTGSQSGVYTYPEGALQRPSFDPCYSQCAKTGQPQDCCTGKYQSPSVCKPSIYSADAKMVCPDAYSYAFDDQTSTFIIPAGGGFEIIFCPPGRSTTILATYKQQLSELAQGGLVVGTTANKQDKLHRRGNGEKDSIDATRGGDQDDFNDAVKEKGEEVSYVVDGNEFRGAKLAHPDDRFTYSHESVREEL